MLCGDHGDELLLSVPGPDAEHHMRDLHAWLANEDELQGRLTLRSHPIRPREMGGILDLIAVALGSGGTGAVLAGSLSTWLTQRRMDITVTVSAPDGRQLTVDVRRARDTQTVVRDIQALLDSS